MVIDKGANAGQYVSLALNSKNNPGIAYFDGTNGDLKFALFDGSKWSDETVDGKGSVGLYPSFTFDNANEPVVTYFNKTKGKLTFALKKNNLTWGFENVDAFRRQRRPVQFTRRFAKHRPLHGRVCRQHHRQCHVGRTPERRNLAGETRRQDQRQRGFPVDGLRL